MSIVPPNFVDLVKNVIPVPNYLWTIAANTCSVRPYLFVATLLPATLFLFTRIFATDAGDVIVDNSRRSAHAIANKRPNKGRRGPVPLGKRMGPNKTAKATRFLFIPINVAERIGFTFLLANFASELAISWTSLIDRCDACSDTGTSIANGPMIRELQPGQFFFTAGWAGIPMSVLVQNRAGWASTLQSVGLPPGDYTVVLTATVRSSNPTTLTVQARFFINMPIAGFPTQWESDLQDYEAIDGQELEILQWTTLHVPPTLTATITWQWQTLSIGLPIFTRIEGQVMISGKDTCHSLSL